MAYSSVVQTFDCWHYGGGGDDDDDNGNDELL